MSKIYIPDWFGFTLIVLYGFLAISKIARSGKGNYEVMEKSWINFCDGFIAFMIFIFLIMNWYSG